ncbi:MAG: phage portal protein [Bacteroidaceae bacterium]
MVNTIIEYLNKRGFTTTPSEYYAYIQEWDDWYKGYFKPFHSYVQYNGTSYISKKMYSLGMAKKICEDHANLIMNEKVQISTGNDVIDDVLKKNLDFNNFRVRANQLVELTFALGTGAFVEYKDSFGNSIIDYIRAQMIYPLSWDNGDITECAFGSVRNINGKNYYYINIHTIDAKGNYIIENKLIDKDSGAEMIMDGVEPIVNTGSAIPRFQIVTPNVVNNIDYDVPMGISIFANAIDQLKAVDVAYDSYVNEFILGKKRIIIPLSMTRIEADSAGIYKPVFDPNDVTFYAMNDESVDGIKEINMEIRAEPHEAGLQRFLALLGDKCGLGADHYKFELGSAVTATQVISEKSDMFQNLKKNELVFESAMTNMAKALADMDGIDSNKLEIKVDFDDSIITDRDSERSRILPLVSMDKYPLKEYLVNYENYTEDEAQNIVDESKNTSEESDLMDNFSGDPNA